MAGARRPAPWSICCSVVAVEIGVLRGAGAPVCVASGGCESVGFYAAPQQQSSGGLQNSEHNKENAAIEPLNLLVWARTDSTRKLGKASSYRA